MRLNPQHAPLYGECLLTVRLNDEDVCWPEEEEEEEEVQLYLIFSGSNQRHLTTMQRVSHVTLQAMCPAHDVCEQVLVTLCSARPDGQVIVLSQEIFCFVPDLALDMAKFLLENTAPQGALLLDDHQVPLKECEKMDQSLALALRHLTQTQQRAAPGGDTQQQAGRQAHMHTEVPRVGVSEPGTWNVGSTELENGLDLCQRQQRSTLLHFAASRGLRRVALFLLQQPGGRELLTQADERGDTPVSLARQKGHQHLVEVFSEYDLWVEPPDRLNICPEGGTFQHHPGLGTYTLTLPTCPEREREGDDWERSLNSLLHDDIHELRRLVQLHRGRKKNDFSDITPTPASLYAPHNHGPDSPAGGVWPCSNSQRGSEEAASFAPAAVDSPGSVLPLAERREGENCVDREASCAARSRHHIQEEETSEQDGGTYWHRVHRKAKKRTTKTSTTSRPGPEATSFPIETLVVVTYEGSSHSPCTEETLLPITPLSGLGVNTKGSGNRSVALVTSSVEKQEGEKSELGLGTLDILTEKEKLSQTKTDVKRERKTTETTCFLTSESASKEKGAMGQGHSLDPEGSQSSVEASEHPDCQGSPHPQGVEGKARKLLWSDRGCAGSVVGPLPPEPRTVPNRVWHQDENMACEATGIDAPKNKAASQTIWYDGDPTGETLGDVRQVDSQVSGHGTQQQPGHAPSGEALASALCQPLTVGPQPALSHGPGAQSQEVHRTLQDRKGRHDGGGEEWKEGGVPGGSAEGVDRATFNNGQSAEREEVETGGAEKGRKKRRKKRGKRGGTEAKLSSSSESPSQIETQTEGERGGERRADTETTPEAAAKTGSASESVLRKEADESAMHLPTQAEDENTDLYGPSPALLNPPEPGQTGTGTTEVAALVCSELKEKPQSMEPVTMADDMETTQLCQSKDSTVSVAREVLGDLAEPNFAADLPSPHSEPTQSADALSVDEFPQHNKELVASVKRSSTQPVQILETVRGNTAEAAESMDPTNLAQRGLRIAKSTGFLGSVPLKEATECWEHVEDGRRVLGEAEDVPLLPKQEGRAQAPGGEYLEHCLATESPIDGRSEEENNEAGGVKEEMSTGRGRSEANDNEGAEEQSPNGARERPGGVQYTGLNDSVAGEREEETGSTEKGDVNKMGLREDEGGCEGDGRRNLAPAREENKRSSSEELAATAVAVVTVAIASAAASVELTQVQRRCPVSPSKEQVSGLLPNINRDDVKQLDVEVPSKAVDQLAEVSHTDLSEPVIHSNFEPLAESNAFVLTQKDTQLDNKESAQAQNQLSVYSHRDSFTGFSSNEQDGIKLESVTIVCKVHIMDDKVVSNLPTQSSSKDQAHPEQSPLADTALPTQQREPAKSADSPEKAYMKPSADKTITQLDSHVQLHPDSQPPCPVIDTGQQGTIAGTLDQQSEADTSPVKQSGGHSFPTEECICDTVAELVRGQPDAQDFDSPEPHDHSSVSPASPAAQSDMVDSVFKVEAAGSCDHGVADMLSPKTESQKCDPCPESQEKEHGDVTQEDEVIPPRCEITLPVTLCDSPAHTKNGTAHSNSLSEELSTTDSDGGKPQSSSPEIESGRGAFWREARDTAPPENEEGMLQGLETDDNALDVVDGWKERERRKTKEREYTLEVTAPDSTQGEPEVHLTEREHPLQTASISDSTHVSEIQRERESFYPLQPLPDPCPPPPSNTQATTCTDLHQDIHGDAGEECVSVCVLRTEASVGSEGSPTVTAELNDSVFKKPEDPVSSPEDRERAVRVSWSLTDDSSSLGPPSTSPLSSQGALSAGTGGMATGGSWKSKDGEGEGGSCGGGEEEEKDQLTENPVTSAILRTSIRSLSPFRRHSWEPGRCNAAGETGTVPRSTLKSMEGKRAKPSLHRRSMSWCPSNMPHPDKQQIDNRSYSLEGLEVEEGTDQASCSCLGASDREGRPAGRGVRLDSQERCGGSLVSLTEEEPEGDGSSIDSQSPHRAISMTTSCPAIPLKQTLTKSISMVTISHRETDVNGRPRTKRRISFSLSISPLFPKTRSFFTIDSSSSDEDLEAGRAGSFSSTSGSLEYSISEEEPGPLRSDSEKGGGGTKVSRTFSYLRNKMSKKSKEKDKERKGEKERESKERERKAMNGHLFSPAIPPPPTMCQQCNKPLHSKEAFVCNNCGVYIHKSCRESLPACTKAKLKQSMLPEAGPGSVVNMRTKSSYLASSLSSSSRDRWSTLTSTEDLACARRNSSMPFNSYSNLSKSISTSNIAGLDDGPLKTLRCLSQSTDNLHQSSKVNASTESLTDEGTEMMDSQLLGEFDCDVKDLEADSWSATVDKKFLKLHKKDEVKRQDVIYELFQTEFHHVRTLRIMSEVYYKGIQKELQPDTQTLDKIFPVLEDLLDTHTHFFTLLLERKRASLAEGRNGSFLIRCIGDVLVNQFSGCNAERMKKVYGKFCSRHNEAVNHYKELHARDKRFQAVIKRLMSSSIVRRLSIPECILLVTQRITKYPVLIQRILQHTKDTEEDYVHVSNALRHVKELIAAVDSKVHEQEKKKRLKEIYSRTDSKSIMRMKSGQMFAKEDLIRGRRLLHEGAVQLKNNAGRLKDVHAMLLSDVLVFLQEKDQKYVFASLDQRSTVISLQKLIVREVANEERGLFLISAWTQTPEMVEVLANSKEERNTWMTIIQNAMHCMEKDEDEGVPSESEEDRRQQENRAKEIRELLRKKDEQIVSLLEEKVHIFRDLCDFSPCPDEPNPPIRERMLFRATPDEVTKGEPIMKDALKEVETLHSLVNSNVGGAGCSTSVGQAGGGVGPVCLPRRAETFGGFDSHQMNSNKNGEKDDGDDAIDLRRTESDSVLKKGATTSLQMLLKRNNEQVLHSVTHLHNLLTALQAVVVQQDSYIEDQRQVLSDRPHTNPSSRHSSSSSLSSSSSSRPSSLIEQEKQRSLERQRQEAASLQKQQAAHQEERRKREKEWEVRERVLGEREERLVEEEEEATRRRKELEQDREELQRRKEEYQRDLERLREAQRRLERDKEALRRETERLEAIRKEESSHLQRYQRTSSTASEDSLRFHSSGSLDLEPREALDQPKEVELSSSAPNKEPFLRIGSKRMGKNFNPFSSSSSKAQGGEKESQLPTRLLQLAKSKEKKDKKKRKGKGGEPTQRENPATVMSEPQNDGDIFFC